MIAFYRRFEAVLVGTASLIAIAVAWQLAVDNGFIDPFFISTPLAVAREAMTQAADGTLFVNISATLHAFSLALALAAAVGIGLGVLAGWFRDVEAALDPFIWFKYSAPTIAFYPIFIAYLGYGLPTVVTVGFLFALTPIYANTLAGIRNVDRDLARTARAFGARPLDVFVRVALPGSVPLLVAGFRLGVGRALTGVVVAELFGSTAGLGYSITQHAQLMQTAPMMVSIVAIVLIGVALTQALGFVERKTDAWRVDAE
ncbi:NitT/TauT family transport system permease protein [Breoghania corrubedonensis]|uniref:NitT/TauT family transport system permease protein n=1 Tax=Breoghania corrubedonensis TaxID=665038 RepID=A0A2T5V6M2_9HYPH|nr:ABC transporter permease [Breoghania corrubedonensis]PTW59399.1 NitT/TauT family transport system permease protein [Breoghania corrubedonensis]